MKVKSIAGNFIFILLISLFPQVIKWIHHRMIIGLNPFVGPAFLIIIFLIVILFFILSYQWLKRNGINNNRTEPVILFALAIFCGLISWLLSANTSIDFHMADTMYVISYKRVFLKYLILFGIFALIYFLFPIVFKRDLNIRLARFHFWVTYIGLNVVVTISSLDLEMNRPHHYTDYGGWNMFNRIDYYKLLIIFPVFFVVVSQLVFIFNMIQVILRPRDGR